MIDLEDRIRTWTDAAASDVAPVTVDEVLARAPRSPRRAPWLLAAAAVLVVVLVVAVLATRGTEDATEVIDEGPVATEVAFTVLGVSELSEERIGTLRSARTAGGVADLWAAAGLEGAPGADLATSGVVSITISDDLCPPTLDRFDRTGEAEITPVFVETAETCEEPEVARTFVVAVEWASVGGSFRLRSEDRTLDVAPPLAAPASSTVVWPADATTADRSSPAAAARSFVTHLLGSDEVGTTRVTGSRVDEPNRVDITVGPITTYVLVAPTDDGWVVLQMGESGLGMGAVPPTLTVPPVADAATIDLLITTDRSVTRVVTEAARPETQLPLPPGTLVSVGVVQRAEDGTLVGLSAGHF